jgi:single-stranded DNA-binding protein
MAATPAAARPTALEDNAYYLNVTAWGAGGELRLAKGRSVAIDGRWDRREWTTQDGHKRETVDSAAENVQFLAGRDAPAKPAATCQDEPADPAPAHPHRETVEDDIPF